MYVQGPRPQRGPGRSGRSWPQSDDPDNVASSFTSPDALGDTEFSFRHTAAPSPVARVVSPAAAAEKVGPAAAAVATATARQPRLGRPREVPTSRVVAPAIANIIATPRAWPLTVEPDALGDTTDAREPAVIARWRSAVAARTSYDGTHNVATRMPSGPSTGKLAERYHDRQGVSRYALAPAAVLAADAAIGQQLDQDITAGQRVQIVEQAPADAANAVQRLATGTAAAAGDTARGIVSGILGIPTWSVPVVIGATALLAAKILLPGLIPWGRR